MLSIFDWVLTTRSVTGAIAICVKAWKTRKQIPATTIRIIAWIRRSSRSLWNVVSMKKWRDRRRLLSCLLEPIMCSHCGATYSSAQVEWWRSRMDQALLHAKTASPIYPEYEPYPLEDRRWFRNGAPPKDGLSPIICPICKETGRGSARTAISETMDVFEENLPNPRGWNGAEMYGLVLHGKITPAGFAAIGKCQMPGCGADSSVDWPNALCDAHHMVKALDNIDRGSGWDRTTVLRLKDQGLVEITSLDNVDPELTPKGREVLASHRSDLQALRGWRVVWRLP